MQIYSRCLPQKRKRVKNLSRILALVICVVLGSCASVVDSKNSWFRDRNVCKRLVGEVLVYPVFVQQKKGSVWTEEDRFLYLDSLQKGLMWIQQQAAENSIKLNFVIKAHPEVMKKGLPGKSVKGALAMLSGTKSHVKFNKHYDNISKKISPKIEKKEVLKPFVKKIKSKERLIAKLRNAYEVESVVLMFIHKPEELNHLYLNMNSITNDDVEYIVTTFQSPAVINYQVLQLFGAATMNYNNGKKKEKASKLIVEELFPDDIMANLGKDIQVLSLGEYTQYLIGWTNEEKDYYKNMVSERKVIVK
jgi:hypothetical protein